MRCLIVGPESAPLKRLSRYFKERGWQLQHAAAASSLPADSHSQSSIDLTVVEAAAHDASLEADIAALRRIAGDSVIIVVGEPSIAARLRALSMGANDFVPFEIPLDLLQARVAALLRLRCERFNPIYELGGLVVDVLHRRVSEDGHELHLSPKEFQLLVMFVQNCGKTLSRGEIIEKLWGDGGQSEDNMLENQVSRLRRKLQTPERGIVTVRGVGYRFETSALQLRSTE
ncbi:MAG: response regulator transcription factor [Alphaproteobacteria bacterium]|nr:response regulator transcription factor [Alphaproteobacteria bacterium]MDE2265195.1 response regulator transcription factor [Alphaproteobacteria bacterium]